MLRSRCASVSVQKALKDSMSELSKEVHLAASYGELSGSLQQRIELVMRFFLTLDEEVEAPATEALPQTFAFGRADNIRHGCGFRHRRHLRDGTRVEPSARPPTPCSQAIRRNRRCYPRPKTLFPRRRPSSQGRQAHGLQRAVQHKVHLEHVDRGLAEDAQESALGALGDDLAHLVFALARGFRQARYLVLGGIGRDFGVEP